jgi:hypothetical protein
MDGFLEIKNHINQPEMGFLMGLKYEELRYMIEWVCFMGYYPTQMI